MGRWKDSCNRYNKESMSFKVDDMINGQCKVGDTVLGS